MWVVVAIGALSKYTFILSAHSFREFSIGDAFVGYHEDTIPSIVMQVCNEVEEEGDDLHKEPEDTWEIKVRTQSSHLMTLFGLRENNMRQRSVPKPVIMPTLSILKEKVVPEMQTLFFLLV